MGNSRKIWSYLKEVTPKQSRILPSSVELNGSVCSETDLIADAFNDFYVNCAKKVTQNLPVITSNMYSEEVDHSLENNCVFNLKPVSPVLLLRKLSLI